MRAKDVMTKSVVAVLADMPARAAAVCMKEYSVGMLPVCDARGLCGIITDRDIVVRVLAAGHDPDAIAIREVMSPEPVYCDKEQELSEVARIMELEHVRRIPVMDAEEGLVGIISVDDLSRWPEVSGLLAAVVSAAAARRA